MRFPNKFKYVWWGLILIGCGFLIYLRRADIFAGKAQPFDTVLLAITSALVLIPFFSELTLLGVTLKQQVEDAKKEIKQDVKEQIYSLRSEFQNIVGINTRLNSQVFVNPLPPTDSQLPALEQQIKDILVDFKEKLGLTTQPRRVQDLIPPDDTILAFSSRYQVEREVRRIWNNRFGQIHEGRTRPQSVYRMVEDLVRAEIIPPAIGHSIREVYAIGSPAVHGEEPSPGQISFLTDVVPTLVQTLRGIA